MDLTDILPLDGVKVRSSASSKKRLLHDLGDVAAGLYGLDAEAVIEALLEREALGPTGVGDGVALPHARMDNIDGIKGLFIRLEKPVDFEAVDRKPVDLIFALLAPESAGVDHLKALALVSRTLRSSDICSKLRANSDAATLHTILTEVSRTQAA